MASDGVPAGTTGQRVARLDQATRWLEDNVAVDRVAPFVAAAARPFNRRPVADWLRGTWLGHALHPLLTDVPLGCWIGALLLDMVPGRERASQNLIASGLAAVPMTAAAGLSEWETMEHPGEKRVAAVHAIGNVLAAGAFTRSWALRRNGQQGGGIRWAFLGGTMALVTGYLGGHMSFARQVGTGHRGTIPGESVIRVRLVRSRLP